ncbi:MAG: NAD(P)H-binding protein [Vicinamibacteraceae bacterium]
MATITVMGASGNIGSKITEHLLAGGHTVRAIGRSAEKLAGAKARGAEVLLGDAADADFLGRAFSGADGAFTMQPSSPVSPDLRAEQDRDGEAILAAATRSGIRHLVAISSVGAQVPAGTGPIAGLHRQEERLKQLTGANVLALRPGYFFENFLHALPLIRHQGINGGGAAGTTTIPMIATRDIAAVAAGALAARAWTGFQVRELLGPRDLTFAEATRIVGAAIDKPELAYVQFPYADYSAALQQAGLSQSVADLYAEMEKAFNDGIVVSVEGRSPANTTPTTLEQFTREVLAPAYAAL